MAKDNTPAKAQLPPPPAPPFHLMAVIDTKLDNILDRLEKKEVPELKIEQIPFAYNLAALQGVTLTEYAPFSGYIKAIMIHWPPGTNALVDVAVGHGLTHLCPREGYLALDDATPILYFNEFVEDNEEIWVEMRNGDAVNPHTITCTISIEGEA